LKLNQLTLGGGINFNFGAVSNKNYTLQYLDMLGSGSWLKLLDIGSRASNWTAVISDPATNAGRYYRVVTPQQP